MLLRTTLVLMLATAVSKSGWAQPSAAARPAFEVAVIKPVPAGPPEPGAFIGMKVTGQQVTIGRIPMESLVGLAFGVQSSQVEGPNWLTHPSPTEGLVYDIAAKMPEGATEADLPSMIATMLAERFRMRVRKSRKQGDVYSLKVAKGGVKFPRTERAPASEDLARKNLPKGTRGGQFRGATVTEVGDGAMLIEASSPDGLLYFLSSLLQPVPVIDGTNLKGSYDIKIEIPPAGDLQPAGGAPVNRADQRRDRVNDALAKVGLKLDRQKGPVDTVVVEQIEKLPTEN